MTQLHAADLDLLAPCFRDTGAVLAAIPADRWDAPSPCAEWTVREVADHLVEALGAASPRSCRARLRDRPADVLAAYDDATRRCLAAFDRPGVLAAEHPFLDGGTVPGHVDRDHQPVGVAGARLGPGHRRGPALRAVAGRGDRAASRSPTVRSAADCYADPVPVPADAPPLVALLGKLGRVRVMLLDVRRGAARGLDVRLAGRPGGAADHGRGRVDGLVGAGVLRGAGRRGTVRGPLRPPRHR